MRPIKFRAWERYEKQMGFVKQIIFNLNNRPFEVVVYLKNGDAIRGIPGDNVDIEQFTGLHDKNGVEIYEGDVLEGDVMKYDKSKKKRYIVYWDEKWCCWSAHFINESKREWVDNLSRYDIDMVTVIGNIHEVKK